MLEILGEGGMGIVYRALDPVMNREVTVKTIRDPQDKAALELFHRECAVLANITHPNIVEIFDIGEIQEAGAKRPYFVMPLLPGTTLQELIKTSSPRLTVERSVQMIGQVCRGLQAAHDHGLIHRDLKPSNLFVLPDDSVKIIDFGVAHLTSHQSATGLKGTVMYMAPEQLQLKDQPTPLSDQFSLAVVCYEMLARRHPFSATGREDLIQAILNYTPPPVSEFNPLVNSSMCQVIHKALAKQPFHRFSDVRAFSDCLQKACRGEPIDIFDPARIAPRLARARKAFQDGDLDDAAERIRELESESFLAPEIDELRKEIEDVRRAKTVKQLVETARRRFDEGEYVRALQKVQEALNLDSSNMDAFTLRGAIESKRSASQIEEWFRLANQHMDNHAYAHARQALEKVLDLRPREARAKTLLAEVERREQEHIRLRNDQREAYQSALNAYQRGEINSALNKLERVLDLDRRAPYSTSPDQAAAYQKLYEEVRSKREQLASRETEARRHLNSGNFAEAKSICDEILSAYPNNVLFGALRDDVEQAQRQEFSAYLAKVEREVAAEPDFNRKVSILEEASQKHPSESRFQESLRQVRSRRDLVDSIAGRARTFEEGRQFSEALGLWEMLRGIDPKYPGLDIEIDRLHKRREQQLRADSKYHWVSQIDQALIIRNYDKAASLALDALAEFPDDPELSALAKQAQQAQTRASDAAEKINQGKDLCIAGNAKEALDLLREALQLDPHNPAVRTGLLEILLKAAGPHIDGDWRAAETLVQEALDLDPSNPGARSLSTLIQDKRQAEQVSAALYRARELQTQGNLKDAIAEVDKMRAAYPRESRLIQLRSVLQQGLSAKDVEEVRARDPKEVNELTGQTNETRTITELDVAFRRADAHSKYGADPEFRKPISETEEGLRREREAIAATPIELSVASQATPPPPVPPPQADTTQTGSTHTLGKFWSATLPPAARRFLWPAVGLGAAALALLLVVNKPRRHSLPSSPENVQVSFQVDPPGATISVDNQAITGTAAEITRGSHTLHADREGYLSRDLSFNVRDRGPIVLALAPAPHAIRIFADSVKTGKVLLDDAEIEPLQDGSSSYDLAEGGKHTLKLLDGRNNKVFSIEFQAETAVPARLASAPVATVDIPVNVVSSLGSQAFAYSSVKGMQAGLKDGERKPTPPEGLELKLPSGSNEITFDDGKKPVSFPLESGNGPLLTIRVGAASKGTLMISSTVDGAYVFIDGKPSSRFVRAQSWVGSLDPGEHTAQLKRDGYDDSPEQKFTIVAGKTERRTINLPLSVTTAFLQIQGGTPEAQVWLDGRQGGVLDSSGSFGPVPVAPDTAHTIQFKKTYFEDSPELRKRASVRQTIAISGSDARLKAFGTLAFTAVTPAETQLTVQLRGGVPERVTDRANTPLAEGTYTVRGTAGDQYMPSDLQDVQIRSGQKTEIAVRLNSKQTQETKTPTNSKRVQEVTELFAADPASWTNDHGFWRHEGNVYFNELTFTHVFDVLKIKKLIGFEKVQWRVFDNDDNFWEFELDDKNFTKREYVARKVTKEYPKQPHKAGQGDSYRLEITVEPNQVTTKIGELTDITPRKGGERTNRTGFFGKVGLKLLQ